MESVQTQTQTQTQSWLAAIHAFQCEDFALALNLFTQLSRSMKVLYNCGKCNEMLGLFDDAEACFSAAISADVYSPLPYFARGVLLHKMGEYAKAIQDYTQSLFLLKERSYIDFSLLGAKFVLNRAELLYNRALALVSLSLYSRATEDASTAARYRSSYELHHNKIESLRVELVALRNSGAGRVFLREPSYISEVDAMSDKRRTVRQERKDRKEKEVGQQQQQQQQQQYLVSPPIHPDHPPPIPNRRVNVVPSVSLPTTTTTDPSAPAFLFAGDRAAAATATTMTTIMAPPPPSRAELRREKQLPKLPSTRSSSSLIARTEKFNINDVPPSKMPFGRVPQKNATVSMETRRRSVSDPIPAVSPSPPSRAPPSPVRPRTGSNARGGGSPTPPRSLQQPRSQQRRVLAVNGSGSSVIIPSSSSSFSHTRSSSSSSPPLMSSRSARGSVKHVVAHRTRQQGPQRAASSSRGAGAVGGDGGGGFKPPRSSNLTLH